MCTRIGLSRCNVSVGRQAFKAHLRKHQFDALGAAICTSNIGPHRLTHRGLPRSIGQKGLAMSQVKKILIVGGGTSGWLAANYLVRMLGGVEVTLIESKDIPTIGVGEATIPPIRTLVAALGIEEAEFMKAASATFKIGLKFNNWLHAPDRPGDVAHSYYHVFGNFGQVDGQLLAPYWALDSERGDKSFVDYTMVEGGVCDAGRSPKRITDPQYSGPIQYAYHFDAGKLVDFLKDYGKAKGVKHLIGNVTETVLGDDGNIARLHTQELGDLEADLFIDCTGFAGHLIEKKLGTDYTDLMDVLFCDSAVALQVPFSDPKTAINPFTTVTAQSEGWTWDIPLNNRRGIGYVHSSKYTEPEEAERVLRQYIGAEAEGIEARHLRFRTGYRREQWKGNCVAIGLSAGFLEPLESTGIYLVDAALRLLVDLVSTTEKFPIAANDFNKRMSATFEDIVDFVKLHYVLTKRTDTQFWTDNTDPATWTDSLKDKVESWSARVPGVYEFSGFPNVFGLTNYMQILYGMDFGPDLTGQEQRYSMMAKARQQAQNFAKGVQGGIQVMPEHRAIIDEIYSSGFKPVRRQI